MGCLLTTTWPQIKRELRQATLPWAKVKGPIGNLIMTLDQWSINMPTPFKFQIMGPNNQVHIEWQYAPGHATKQFYREFQEHIESKLWQQASAYRHGHGLILQDMAPDIYSAKMHYRAMIKKGRMSDAALMTTIMAGGTWPNSRIAEHNDARHSACPFCQAPQQT